MRKLLSNNKGFTLAEIVVTVGILGIISWGVYSGVDQWNKSLASIKRTSSSFNIVTEVLNSFAVRGQFIQVDYSDDLGVTILNRWRAEGRLPTAWSKSGNIVEAYVCGDTCPVGRYGYIAKPITGFRGLYKVTVLITHPDWKAPKVVYALTGE